MDEKFEQMFDSGQSGQNDNIESLDDTHCESFAEFAVRGGGSHTFCTACTDRTPVKKGHAYVVRNDKTDEYAEAIFNTHPCSKMPGKFERQMTVQRELTPEDIKQLALRRQGEQDAMKKIKEKVKEYELNMKVSNVEYSFDESIIYCYFTAPERVDFRELVRDLGHTFRKRIELKQIGARDETRMLGGFGHCGMQLCCNGTLRAAVLPSVSMKMAKVQKLSTNPQNLLGLCGKLRCCLEYEYKGYQEEGPIGPTPEEIANAEPKKTSTEVLNDFDFTE